MDYLIVAVLGLLVLTRLYKFDQVRSVRHFRFAWACVIATVAIMAAGQLLTITANTKSNETEIVLLTNAAILAVLAVSLYLWYKAVTADTNKTADNA